ncbi:hypothetical protein MIND_00871500 [Mycena indigotica]|uniref:Uncharacterized protein n=1 Tax=Mycena indigotica TaxID=2126181 RepID=A0A8H6SHU9_9AGAR|nr:uncharacterized protein MIND_00871500 [Mycena indigotica]KAF7299228.1 hypothetical protein MIND_00871500 [Mycena indigotica]
MHTTTQSPHTPTRKRTRSNSTAGPSRKKQCSNERQACPSLQESPIKASAPVCNLEKILRRLAQGVDVATVQNLKKVVAADVGDDMPVLVQSIIEHAQELVAERCCNYKGKNKLLEGELYVEWLIEIEYILDAVENMLAAKLHITLGRVLFTLLFHLIEEYISAVDSYQDGWSHDRFPWVMTLVEEANAANRAIDHRSSEAVETAESVLDRLDKIFVRVIRQFKAESMDYRRLAGLVGMKEDAIARSCCLLSEQTGFGDADEMGFELLSESREAMTKWRDQGKSKAKRRSSGETEEDDD